MNGSDFEELVLSIRQAGKIRRGEMEPPGGRSAQGWISMNDHSRAALFQALAELAERYPHWRFGQLVSNVAGWADVALWDIEDEQLLAAANLHIDHLKCREQQAVKLA